MSYLEYNAKYVPSGLRKPLYLNWPIVLLLTAVAGIGFLMLYSVAGGSASPWMEPQVKRFGVGMAAMFVIAMVPIWFWRNMSAMAYAVSLVLLLYVEFFGSVGMGAQRWIDLGFMRLQPSELMKLFAVLYAADYTSRKLMDMGSFRRGFVPMAMVMVLVGALLGAALAVGSFALLP